MLRTAAGKNEPTPIVPPTESASPAKESMTTHATNPATKRDRAGDNAAQASAAPSASLAPDEPLGVRSISMGAILHEGGVGFRVWAPNADSVAVIGTFNEWKADRHPMTKEEHGNWFLDIAEAKVGDEYLFVLKRGEQELRRVDPYAREVTNSVGNGIIHDPNYDWEGDAFTIHPWNRLVIYELHVGTFNRRGKKRVGTLEDAIAKFDHLEKLGINTIQLMPLCEFAGDQSWGYNPAHLFAVESAYGGANALKAFVKEAHKRGFAVILDVVYNHFGPSDLNLWQFDGWNENDLGGIYFYNDWRADTPWGQTRPDYGRGEVRQFIHDNAMMWLEDYHMDGLRFDMTLYMRSVDGAKELPEGWSLTRWINREITARYPEKITIAEDLQNNDFLTKPEGLGGADFDSQWDAKFVHPIRDVLAQPDDAGRDMQKVCDALCHRYNIDVFERVVYTESHDEVANGKSRVPSEIAPTESDDYFARKRSTLGAAMVFTAPGIPMLFQGQEFLQDKWFDDSQQLEWHRAKDYRGIVHMYRDLIKLRRDVDGVTTGLTGQYIEVADLNPGGRVIAFRRWCDGGPGDDVMVVANFSNQTWKDYFVRFPTAGAWRCRFNSDWVGYGDDFKDTDSHDIEVPGEGEHANGGALAIGPYSVLIYSQDRPAVATS